MFCPDCGVRQPEAHRFCFAGGRLLPAHLVAGRPAKVTDLFLGIPVHETDPAQPLLRVSRYLKDHEWQEPEGTLRFVAGHVRFSIWVVDTAIAAMSLSDTEARRLAEFLLADPTPEPESPARTVGADAPPPRGS
jgi:hypothetical protein